MTDAFANLNDEGNEIVLLGDLTLTDSNMPSKPLAIDGQGHTLTLDGWIYAKNALTFKNVCFSASSGILACGFPLTLAEGNTGTIASVYGGGGAAAGNIEETHVTIESGSITTLYGGSSGASVSVATTNIVINGGTIKSLIGGGTAGSLTSQSNITVNSGTITNIFGGGNSSETTTTNTVINGGTISMIIGGGSKSKVESANVSVNGGNISYIYGGGNNSNAVCDATSVILTGGTVSGAVFGGGNIATATSGRTYVRVEEGATAGSVCGGGNYGPVSHAEVIINGGTINNNVMGGSQYATVESTDVKINGGTILKNVIAGGYVSHVENTTLTISDGNITGVAVGGGLGNADGSLMATTGTAVVNMTGGSVPTIYGGGYAQVRNNGVDTQSATVNISGGTVKQSINGGSHYSDITSSHITVTGGAIFQIFGGCYNGNITKSEIDITCADMTASGYPVYVFGGTVGLPDVASTCETATINLKNYDYETYKENNDLEHRFVLMGAGYKNAVCKNVSINVENCTFGPNDYCEINGAGMEGARVSGDVNITATNNENLKYIYGTSRYDGNPVEGDVNITIDNCTGTGLMLHPTSAIFGDYGKEMTSTAGGVAAVSITDSNIAELTYDAKAKEVNIGLYGTTAFNDGATLSAPVRLVGDAVIVNNVNVVMAGYAAEASPLVTVGTELTIADEGGFINQGEALEKVGNVYCVASALPALSAAPTGTFFTVDGDAFKEIDGKLHVVPGASVTINAANGYQIHSASMNDVELQADDNNLFVFTMPETGATVDAVVSDSTSIDSIGADEDKSARYYSTDGLLQPDACRTGKHGIYLKVTNGSARKVIL